MLPEKITGLKSDLVAFGALVEEMIEKSLKGLLDRDEALLKEVIERDEAKANSSELSLDELCTNMIAQYEPKARDLRTILMGLRMNNDLERMGDHAVNIAESSLYLIERPPVKPLIDIPRMAEVTRRMVSESLQSFVREDAGLARTVCERDQVVDDLADQILRELTTHMSSDASTIPRSLHLLKITGNLERIADLSTNIGEDVIFMVQGRVIKHHADE